MTTPLTSVSTTEFERVRGEVTDDTDRARVFAALCRTNALYMITRTGSGHLGLSRYVTGAELVVDGGYACW